MSVGSSGGGGLEETVAEAEGTIGGKNGEYGDTMSVGVLAATFYGAVDARTGYCVRFLRHF